MVCGVASNEYLPHRTTKITFTSMKQFDSQHAGLPCFKLIKQGKGILSLGNYPYELSPCGLGGSSSGRIVGHIRCNGRTSCLQPLKTWGRVRLVPKERDESEGGGMGVTLTSTHKLIR